MDKIEMQNDYVMLRDLELSEVKTESGIILGKLKYQRLAEIVAVPENEEHFKVGDVVVKPIGRGTPVTIDDVDYECVKKNLLFAKI